MIFYLKNVPATKRVRIPASYAFVIMWSAALEVARDFMCHARITSIIDGVHSAKSLHRFGLALDFQLEGAPYNREEVLIAIRHALGRDFQAIDETNHFHLEYDPEYL